MQIDIPISLLLRGKRQAAWQLCPHTHFITVLPCDIFVSHVILIVLSKLTISFANEIENDVNDTIIINIKNVRNCKFIENVSLRIRILKNHSLIYLVTKIYVF